MLTRTDNGEKERRERESERKKEKEIHSIEEKNTHSNNVKRAGTPVSVELP